MDKQLSRLMAILVLLCGLASAQIVTPLIVSTSGVSPSTIVLVGSPHTGTADQSGTTATVNCGTNIAGNFLAVGIQAGNYDTPITISSVAGNSNTYTLAKAGNQSSWDGARHINAIYYAKNINAGANTVTVTLSPSTSLINVFCNEYSGVDQTSPLDQTSSGSGGNLDPTFAGGPVNNASFITSLYNQELLVGFGSCESGATFTAGGLWTSENTSARAIFEDRIVTTVVGMTPSFSTGVAGPACSAIQATFKAQNATAASGAYTVVTDGFESNTFSLWDVLNPNSVDVAITTSATWVSTGTHGVKLTYPTGSIDINQYIQYNANATEFYEQADVKFVTPDQGTCQSPTLADTCGQRKIFYSKTGPTGDANCTSASFCGYAVLTSDETAAIGGIRLRGAFGNNTDGETCTAQSSAVVAHDVWHTYAMRGIANTPGTGNGSIQVWLDGALVNWTISAGTCTGGTTITNVKMRGTGQTDPFQFFEIGRQYDPTNQAGGQVTTASETRGLDNVTVKIGPQTCTASGC